MQSSSCQSCLISVLCGLEWSVMGAPAAVNTWSSLKYHLAFHLSCSVLQCIFFVLEISSQCD